MKTQLDEAKIRRLVRESITRRMLSEARGTADGASFGGIIGKDLAKQFGFGEGPGDASSDTPSEPLPSTLTSGRQAGQSAASGIAKAVGGKPDIDIKSRSEYVGPTLGEKVKTFIDGIKYINAPFKVSDASSVMTEWKAAVEESNIPIVKAINSDGTLSDEELDLSGDEEGLLRYLLYLKNADDGLKLTETMLTAADSDYRSNLYPHVERFIELINGYTEIDDLDEIAKIVARVVRDDKTPGLFQTKVLLAGFSAENSTTIEAMAPIGLGLGALAVLVAGVGTGGLAWIAIGTATATAVAAIATASVAIIAAAAWGLTAAGNAAMEALDGSPVLVVQNAVNNDESSFLNELAVEVGRTYFPLDRNAENRRDQIEQGLREIVDVEPNKKPNKSIILQYLERN
jgi:hypothetical protein